jgi:hypothetical protein
MPITKRIVRGLQDIRTISGRVDQSFHPYKAYLRIGCLEMEKARRGSERASATHRVKLIDARFQEIEAEEAALLQNLGERNSDTPTTDAKGAEPGTGLRRGKGGFKIRY